MSVVIFQPSVAPFVQQAARALEEAGLLERFYTTLIDAPSSSWQKWSRRVGQALGRDISARLSRRRVTEIAAEKVTAFPFDEMVRLTAGAVDRSGRLGDLFWERSERNFSRKVAKRLCAPVTGVYGYEFSARAAFSRARELGLRTFYDVPAPSPEFVETLLRAELERFPELKTSYTRHTAAREKRRTAHRKSEWDLAHRVIAASKFTRESFATDGRDVSKLSIIPYGAPEPASRDLALAHHRTGAPLRMIWAGTFSLRKGAHYLVDAWLRHHLGRHATLDIYGTVALPDRLLKPAPEGMIFHGPISRADLMVKFQQADLLIFPSLCDGFGLVVTEAWSQGLPVLTTLRAGASDLLRAGENGFLVTPGSADALAETLEKVLAQPTALAPMRECALATAANWQWSDYRKSLGNIVLRDLLARA